MYLFLFINSVSAQSLDYTCDSFKSRLNNLSGHEFNSSNIKDISDEYEEYYENKLKQYFCSNLFPEVCPYEAKKLNRDDFDTDWKYTKAQRKEIEKGEFMASFCKEDPNECSISNPDMTSLKEEYNIFEPITRDLFRENENKYQSYTTNIDGTLLKNRESFTNIMYEGCLIKEKGFNKALGINTSIKNIDNKINEEGKNNNGIFLLLFGFLLGFTSCYFYKKIK